MQEKIQGMKNADNQADREKATEMEKWIHENGYSETGFQQWYIEKYGKDDYENTFGSSSDDEEEEEEVAVVEKPIGYDDFMKEIYWEGEPGNSPATSKDGISIYGKSLLNAYFEDPIADNTVGGFIDWTIRNSAEYHVDKDQMSKVWSYILGDPGEVNKYLEMIENDQKGWTSGVVYKQSNKQATKEQE
jgi:hypothetical protein